MGMEKHIETTELFKVCKDSGVGLNPIYPAKDSRLRVSQMVPGRSQADTPKPADLMIDPCNFFEFLYTCAP